MASSPSTKKLPLFYPEKDPPRLKYTEADHTRAFRSQPLDFITSYLIPKPPDTAILLPPRLHIGWILDEDRMFEYARDHGTECVIDDDDDEGIHPNYFDACGEAVSIALEELNIPYDRRIEIVFACDGDYDPNPTDPDHENLKLALSIGTNYRGPIPKEHVDKLGEFVAPGVKLRWFLDMDRWQWTRARRRAQPNGKAIRRTAATQTDRPLASSS